MLNAILAIIVFILVIAAIWLSIDFRGGRRNHRELASSAKKFPLRQSDVQLISDGRLFFNTLFADLEQAQSYVYLSFFIIKEKGIGAQFLALLERKARDGINVHLLVDRFGSSLTRATIKRLRESGISFSYARKISFPYFFYSINRRYHRKVAVIDGEVGYVGGFNVGDEYVGKDTKLGYWRDLHLRFEHEGVADLQEVFLDDWASSGAAPPKVSTKIETARGTIKHQVLITEGLGLSDLLVDMFKKARSYAIITTPYYIPGKTLQNEIVAMAKRGVHVDLLLPKKEDHPLVKDAAYPYFAELLQSGCRIYEYAEGFYHGKAIIIDGELADIGSANIDKRSFYLNDELDVLFYEKSPLISDAEKLARADIKKAVEITMKDVEARTLLERGKTRIATWVEELL